MQHPETIIVRVKPNKYRPPPSPDAPVKYDATLDDGTPVCTRQREPYYAAARQLLKLGLAEPTTRYVMRWARGERTGDPNEPDIDCMVSTVGEAAKWTVREGEDGLRNDRWKPRPSRIINSFPRPA